MSGGGEQIRGDRYVLVEQLSASSDSAVWRAHDDVLNRPVVVKEFTAQRGSDPAWREEFSNTADRLVALSHPGLVKVYEHGASDDSCWLAMALAEGEPLAGRLAADPPMSPAAALDVIGQAGLALGAAHAGGVAHGGLDASNLLVAGSVVRVVGFSFAATGTPEADVRALGEVARQALTGSTAPAGTAGGERAALPSDVADFLDWTTGAGRARPAGGATEVGRTALALSAALAGRHSTTVVPSPTKPAGAVDPAGQVETPYEEMQRKRVRNRLIALAAIVVIGGAILLRFIGQGGGEVTVPDVVGVPLDQAQITLTSAGLRDTQSVAAGGTDSGGTVAAESPAAGTRVKAGTTITLTLGAGNP
jgi:hypothetical protein